MSNSVNNTDFREMEDSVTFAQVAARKVTAPSDFSSPINSKPLPDSAISVSFAEMSNSTMAPPFTGGHGKTYVTCVRPPGTESYAEAVKTSRGVWLDGVPVNPSKLQLATATNTSCMESVTNSVTHEQESVLSSWVDDDQCFFDSIRISSEENGAKWRETTTTTRASNNNNGGNGNGNGGRVEQQNSSQSYSNSGGSGIRSRRGGRGWRTITRGENNNNSNNNNNNNNNNVSSRRRRNQNNSNVTPANSNNNNNNNNSGESNGRKKSGAESTNLSGGRFDALADIALRRHL